ncbi:tRNA (adenosine(37)-N6)-threonylcarbamoyltransferase complex transferase subunit TsaD [Aliifodinibius sp. S!AR15-10]|uniref:tRNA (adenosine(37)-N6)-threonylcarbamoyltransferase complex transferase subunit TsaD n=1 Tax=Aliifodinibius sp. S!AR15-10 TaxID=2950437 RepID=UPI002860831B|nr:tRNA (adenosine(37)-N6)-threonylcarbamoyltransferase complex transferase subunit TsaD [Aliifodinibius sp. S!AR15-10]MDR8393109.1 tRNA (adenosine(37)-N6)-threonylcarbamoyltransferase complex transferase subunit TsaD [Aliifodinibius sp. S!AR15-10]
MRILAQLYVNTQYETWIIMNILGIESSCDETAAAVYTDEGLKSNIVASQAVHEQFGGVVPELASRAHHKTIWRTVSQALYEADTELDTIDAIAVTQGPGLMGALLVGLCFSKGLALSRGIKLIGVNHMDAHIYANFIEEKPQYPFVALTVSGGHTHLIHVTAPFEHKMLGQTRDDAAGEAFDKIGKILGLPYPAGPIIDEKSSEGDPNFHDFPQAMMDGGFEFSFSGLKTSVLYYLEDKDDKFVEKHMNDICASVSRAITDVLTKKLKWAVKKTGVDTILLAGGVSANSMLRAKTEELANDKSLQLYIPRIEFCTDNAAMIAITGHMMAERGEFSDMNLKPFAQLSHGT